MDEEIVMVLCLSLLTMNGFIGVLIWHNIRAFAYGFIFGPFGWILAMTRRCDEVISRNANETNMLLQRILTEVQSSHKELYSKLDFMEKHFNMMMKNVHDRIDELSDVHDYNSVLTTVERKV